MTNLTEQVFGVFIHACFLQPESCLEYLAPETIWVDADGSVQGIQGALEKARAAARGWAQLAGTELPELTNVVELPLGDTERIVTCSLSLCNPLKARQPLQIPLSVLFKNVQTQWRVWYVHCQFPQPCSENVPLSLQAATSPETVHAASLQAPQVLAGSKTSCNLFFDEVIELIPGCVFRYTADEREYMDFVSEKLLSMLGYTEEEFREKIQNRFSLMIYEEDRARVLEEIDQQIAAGTYDICEYRIQTKSGELRWFFDSGHVVMDENGQQWFYVVLSDITEQKKLRIEVAQQLSFLHTVFDSMPCGVVHYRIQGTTLVPARANRAACMLFGCFTEQEFLERYAKRTCPLVPGSEIDHMERIAQKTFLSSVPESCTRRIALPDDSVRWLTAAFEKLQMPDGSYQVQAIYTDESEHQESAVRLQALVNAIPSCLIVYEVEPETGKNSISYITEGVYELLGYTRDEVFGSIQEDPLFTIHPEDACEVERALVAAAREERSFSEIYRLRRKDGSFCWVRLDANIAERRGHSLVYYGLFLDMNEAKQLEQQLRESSSRFETLINSVPGCLILFEVTDGETEIKFLSERVSDLLGYTRDELQVLNSADPMLLVHPEDRHIIPEKLASFDPKNGPLDMTYRLRCKNGAYRWVRLSANLVGRRGRTRILHGIYSDLDEVKQLEYELRASSARYEALVESVPGGIAVVEVMKEGPRVTYLSEGFEQLLGYSKGRLLPLVFENAMSIVHPDDADMVAEALQDSVQNNTMLLATYRLLQYDGTYHWVSISAKIVERSAERIMYCAVYFDSETIKRAELELLRQQKKLEIVMEQAKIAIWDYDIATRQCTIPPRNGRTEPLIVENVPEGPIAAGVIVPGSVAEYRRLHQAIQQGERTASADIQYRTSSGNTTWVRMRYVTVLDEEGRPITAIGSSESLEALKAIEQRYQEEMLYRETAGADLVASFRINISRRIVEEGRVYSTGQCVYDIPYDDAYIRASVRNMLSEEDRQRWLYNFAPHQLLRLFNEGKTSFSLDFRCGTSTNAMMWISVNVNLVKRPGGEDVLAFMYARDTTEAMLNKALLDTVVNESFDYIGYINGQTKKYHLFSVRGNAEDLPPMKGDDFEKDIQKLTKEFIIPEDQARCLQNIHMKTILENLDKHGSHVWYHRVLGGDGTIRRKKIHMVYLDREQSLMMVSRTDVTDIYNEEDRKNSLLRAALRAAEQASVAKSEFLSRMSHEIRTPLNAIIGLTELAEDENRLAPLKESFVKVGMSANFLLALINSILDMSRIESGKMSLAEKPFDFFEFLQSLGEIIQPQAAGKKITCSVDFDTSLAKVYRGDSLKLRQIFLNLLGNAIKFTPEGGSILFSVHQKAKTSEATQLCFVVKDTGIGIGEAFLPHLFEPFLQEQSGVTSMYGGTGLGLAICQNLVAMMGGQITVQSQLGKGTAFTVEIWLHEGVTALSQTQSPSPASAEADLSGMHILLAEDHPLNIEVAKKTLERKGCLVDVARNGCEAVDLFSASAPGSFAAVLMDIRMPQMDGLAATKAIRALPRADATTIPIIAMTANAFSEDIEKSHAAGMSAHLAKPINPQLLYATLAELVK